MEKRRQKFSQARIDEIKNDSLLDMGLLSRSDKDSNNSQLQTLKTSQTERDKLLMRIKIESDNSIIEHGLRKLREIIVSAFDENGQNLEFIKFTEDVYKLSYNFFVSTKQFHKINGIVLEFIIDRLPNLLIRGNFLEIYVIFSSHIEGNLPRSIDTLLKYKEQIGEKFTFLLELSTVYCQKSLNPTGWFQLIKINDTENKYPLIYDLLLQSGKPLEMQKRCFQVAKSSYNQISIQFFRDFWLGGYDIDDKVIEDINNLYVITTGSTNTQAIMFKVRKAVTKS